MANMGRPTEDPKCNQMRIRMSNKDVEMIEFCCKETKLSKAEVVRLGIKKVYQELHK